MAPRRGRKKQPKLQRKVSARVGARDTPRDSQPSTLDQNGRVGSPKYSVNTQLLSFRTKLDSEHEMLALIK